MPRAVTDSPTRRTYQTGAGLPKLETSFRPIPLGRDERGDIDGAVRAFAVLIRNKAETPIYIRERNSNAADEIQIAPGENFRIWEPDGVNDITLRGETGGETVDIRTLEAHNDFDLTDKIDAFARSISHFFGTAFRSTETTITGSDVTLDVSGNVDSTITGSDVTLPVTGSVDTTIEGSNVTIPVEGTVDIGTFADTVTIDDIQAASATFDVSGTVDINQIGDTVAISDIQAGTVDIGQIGDSVTIDDIQATSATFDIAGSVDVDSIGDSVTISEIQASSAVFEVTGGITVEGQADFDLSMFSREGKTVTRAYREKALSADSDGNRQTYYWDIQDAALFDGRVTRIEARFYGEEQTDRFGYELQIDRNSTGTWETISPKATLSAGTASNFGGQNVTVEKRFRDGESIFIWEPSEAPRYEIGDSLRLAVRAKEGTNAASGQYAFNAEITATLTEIVNQ